MGAIYKFASKRRLGKEKTVSLMVTILKMNPEDALRLADHWYTTRAFVGR